MSKLRQIWILRAGELTGAYSTAENAIAAIGSYIKRNGITEIDGLPKTVKELKTDGYAMGSYNLTESWSIESTWLNGPYLSY